MIHKKLPSLKKEISFIKEPDKRMLEQAYLLNVSLPNNNHNFDWYMETAILLSKEYNAPSDVIIACLMYKYVKKTHMNDNEFINLFNEQILSLVKLLVQFDDSYVTVDNSEKNKIIKSIFYDVRVTVIKLAEQLVAFKYMDENLLNSDEVTKNALEIYIPIAEVLGIYKLKHSFEDLCFKKNSNYALALKIREEVVEESKQAIEFLKTKIKTTNSKLSSNHRGEFNNIDLSINMRSIYEIYNQVQKWNTSLSTIDDKMLIEILAFCSIKCLVDTRKQCYEALWLIHQFQHQGAFHDYLSWNDDNEYHAIHTKVFIKSNKEKNNAKQKDTYLVDVRICTKEMDKVNLYGIISDWNKENNLQFRLKNNYSFYNKLITLVNDDNLSDKFLSVVNKENHDNIKIKKKDKM